MPVNSTGKGDLFIWKETPSIKPSPELGTATWWGREKESRGPAGATGGTPNLEEEKEEMSKPEHVIRSSRGIKSSSHL